MNLIGRCKDRLTLMKRLGMRNGKLLRRILRKLSLARIKRVIKNHDKNNLNSRRRSSKRKRD